MAVAIAAAVTGYLIWGPGGGLPDTPERTAEGLQKYEFDNVGEMAATSHLVIKATVSKAEVGDKVGDPGEELTNRHVYLDVEEVLYQQKGHDAGDTVIIGEGYWETDGVGVMTEGMEWTEPGDTGYYFLMGPGGNGIYGFTTSPHGRVLIENGKAEVATSDGLSPEEDGPWASANTDFDNVKEVESIIRDAVEAAESGKAEPVEPFED